MDGDSVRFLARPSVNDVQSEIEILRTVPLKRLPEMVVIGTTGDAAQCRIERIHASAPSGAVDRRSSATVLRALGPSRRWQPGPALSDTPACSIDRGVERQL